MTSHNSLNMCRLSRRLVKAYFFEYRQIVRCDSPHFHPIATIFIQQDKLLIWEVGILLMVEYIVIIDPPLNLHSLSFTLHGFSTYAWHSAILKKFAYFHTRCTYITRPPPLSVRNTQIYQNCNNYRKNNIQ